MNIKDIAYSSDDTARERFIALMTEAEADWQLLTYSHAGHSFTDRSADAFGMPGFA